MFLHIAARHCRLRVVLPQKVRSMGRGLLRSSAASSHRAALAPLGPAAWCPQKHRCGIHSTNQARTTRTTAQRRVRPVTTTQSSPTHARAMHFSFCCAVCAHAPKNRAPCHTTALWTRVGYRARQNARAARRLCQRQCAALSAPRYRARHPPPAHTPPRHTPIPCCAR